MEEGDRRDGVLRDEAAALLGGVAAAHRELLEGDDLLDRVGDFPGLGDGLAEDDFLAAVLPVLVDGEVHLEQTLVLLALTAWVPAWSSEELPECPDWQRPENELIPACCFPEKILEPVWQEDRPTRVWAKVTATVRSQASATGLRRPVASTSSGLVLRDWPMMVHLMSEELHWWLFGVG